MREKHLTGRHFFSSRMLRSWATRTHYKSMVSDLMQKKKHIPKISDKFIFTVTDNLYSLQRTNQSSWWEESVVFRKSISVHDQPARDKEHNNVLQGGRTDLNQQIFQVIQTTCLSHYHSSKNRMLEGRIQVWMCSWEVVWSRLGTGRMIDRFHQVYNMERTICKRLHADLRTTYKSSPQLGISSACAEVWSATSRKFSTERKTVLNCWKNRSSTMLEYWETLISSI